MANEEQVAILRQGVAAWYVWREANPDIAIDLTEVNLSGHIFSEPGLFWADLSGANLTRAPFLAH